MIWAGNSRSSAQRPAEGEKSEPKQCACVVCGNVRQAGVLSRFDVGEREMSRVMAMATTPSLKAMIRSTLSLVRSPSRHSTLPLDQQPQLGDQVDSVGRAHSTGTGHDQPIRRRSDRR